MTDRLVVGCAGYYIPGRGEIVAVAGSEGCDLAELVFRPELPSQHGQLVAEALAVLQGLELAADRGFLEVEVHVRQQLRVAGLIHVRAPITEMGPVLNERLGRAYARLARIWVIAVSEGAAGALQLRVQERCGQLVREVAGGASSRAR